VESRGSSRGNCRRASQRAYALDRRCPSNWRNPGELKASFSAASFVGDLIVFNACGNHYRIVALVHYRKQIVYVKKIGTHKEYDKWNL